MAETPTLSGPDPGAADRLTRHGREGISYPFFDEATSALDPHTAERFAQTVNKLKGAATILFIAHQLPKGLAVDEVFSLSGERAAQMRLVEEPNNPETH